MGYLSFCELFLLVPIFIVTIFLGITTTSLPVISSYGQQSNNLVNLSPSTNYPANHHEIPDGRQQLIVIPSLSGNDVAVLEEQAKGNEDVQQGEVLSKHKATDLTEREEQEEDKIVGSTQQNVEEKIMEMQKQYEHNEERTKENVRQAVNKYQENDDIRNEVKYNNNGIPLELPFP
jgi:hypothetical protein